MTLLPCHIRMRARPWQWVFAIVLAAILLGRAAAGIALSPAPGTAIVNMAAVQYSDANGNPLPRANATVSVPIAGAPLLHLVKSAESDPVAAGAVFTYTIQYENTGNATATGVTVIDSLPADVTFQDASSGGIYTSADHRVTWSPGTLAAGNVGSVTVTVQSGAGLANGSSLVNSAVINSAEGAADTAMVTTTIGTGSNLILTKSADRATVQPNGVITYTLSYSNMGNQTATGVRITDTIPSGTAYVTGSGTEPVTLAGGMLSWDIGDLPAGSGGSVEFQVRVFPLASGGQEILNRGSIISAEQAKVSNTTVTTVTTPSLILIKMDTPDPVNAGTNITYNIEVENTGSVPLTGVVLTDPIPAGTTFTSADSGGVYTAGTGQVDWAIGMLAVNEKKAVTLTLLVDSGAVQGQLIENSATVTTNETIPRTVNALSTVNARSPGLVEFYDASWQPAWAYMSGDRVYLQVRDLDQNMDPLVAETVTVVLTDLETGDTETLVLTETGPDTGIFRNTGILTSLDATASNDGKLTVLSDSRIQATYTDPLDASPVYTASALIDPFGVVFDSVTGTPVAGAIVTLRNWDPVTNSCDLTSWPVLPPGQVNPAPPTGADGRFAFPLVPAGDYCFQVTPPAGYTYPSLVPDADLPAGFTIGNGSRGERFTLSAGDPPLIRDIPVDPPSGQLTITKTANKTTAAIGDLILYIIKVTNNGAAPVTGVTLTDDMPHGINYITGSSMLNGAGSSDPEVTGKGALTWDIGLLTPAQSVDIGYRAVVGPDSRTGTGINSAIAAGTSVGAAVISNRARCKIKITEGVFTSKGTIIGRVFMDPDGDGMPKKGDGIPDVALYLEDGTRVITDRSGKFSISGVGAGTHVLRLDETTLPEDVTPVPLTNRFMLNGLSQFIDMSPGGLFKANFAVEKQMAKEKPAPPPEKPPVAVRSAGKAPLVTEPLPETTTEPPLEERIKGMKPDLEFLSPQDQTVSARKNIRVLLKAPADTALTLSVNKENIGADHIGKEVKYAPGKVAVYEFIDVRLKPGQENLIRARIRDPFGIVRSEKEIRVEAVGEPVRILIHPDQTEAAADGRSRIGVTVDLEDRLGNKVVDVVAVTVEVTAGDFLEKDADPSTEGHQVLCRNGVARFTIVAPRETGEAKIRVRVNDLSESADLYFAPHLRPMLMVGVGEVVLGHGRSSGNLDYLKERSWFDDGTYLDGRGAFFLKGNVYKDVLLTAGFDSEKKKTDELFRESDSRIDSEEKYPIYGDESKTGYEVMSRDRLYIKLEKDKSYLLYGDYHTDLTDTKLSAYTRSFNGLKLDLNTDRFRLRSFGSHTDQTQFVDTIPGKGISGLYYLNHSRIIEGSERVVIETRDRLQPDRVLKRETKSRGTDYDIEYDLGTLLFRAAIPGRDSLGNPVYIVATYESSQGGSKYYIYGGRGAYRINDMLEVGATGIVEENGISNYRLFGSDITLKLPGKTTIKAEYAGTSGLFDINNAVLPKNGEGWSFELESKPVDRLTLTGSYRDLSDYYSNPSAVDAVRGTREVGVDAVYEIRPDLSLKAKYLDEDDRINNSSHRLASVGATRKFARTSVSADLSHETSENLTATPAQTPVTPTGLLNGVPFLNAYETPKRATFARLAVERELLPDLSLSLSHKHDLGGEGLSVSEGGLNYRLNKNNRLYVREEYARYENSTQTRTLLGLESELATNTTAYQEYRLADGSDGSRNQKVMGLKNRFKLMEGLTGNLAAEYLNTLNGQGNANEPDAFALATGLEYLPSDDFKITGRFEHRNEIIENGADSYLAEVAAAYKLHPDYSLLVRERYFMEEKGSDKNHTSRLMAGLAYRPLENDRFNALAKIEYKYDKQTISSPGYRTDSFILSTEGIYQVSPDLQLMGKYAGKLEKENGFSSYTDLIAARVMIDLTDRFDFGAEYRLLTSHRTKTHLHGGSVEVGYRLVDKLWLSLGYSFDRFDSDLTGDSYHGDGPFLKLRFKFDEKLF